MSVSVRERRALVAGGVLILLVLTPARGLPAWRAWVADARASAAELGAEAARAEASVRALPATLDSLEDRRHRLVALAPIFVAGGSPAAAAGSLASMVAGIAAAAGLEIGPLAVRPDSAPTGPVRRAAVRGEATSGIQEVAAFIAALEGQPRWLAIRELAVTTADPTAPADRPEALRLVFLVEGLALIRDDEAAP